MIRWPSYYAVDRSIGLMVKGVSRKHDYEKSRRRLSDSAWRSRLVRKKVAFEIATACYVFIIIVA